MSRKTARLRHETRGFDGIDHRIPRNISDSKRARWSRSIHKNSPMPDPVTGTVSNVPYDNE